MAERKNFLNKNFNVNELKKIYKQIGGTKVTGLKKNQIVNKIVSLEKKNFTQNGGFGLNDIVNFFGNTNSVNILNELEPETTVPNFYGGSSDGEDSTQSTDEGESESGSESGSGSDSGKSKEKKKRRRRARAKQDDDNQDAGFNFAFSDTSGLDFSDSSILSDSSFKLDDSSFKLDDSSSFKLDDSSFDLNSSLTSHDSMSSLDYLSDTSY
jgi:hypothetical protein